MKLDDALAALDVHHKVSHYVSEYGPEEGTPTNYMIACEVGQRMVDGLGTEWFEIGTFDNCREWGLTFTVPGWQFCVYEHRNSDAICVQGCPIDEVQPYGPYSGVDKYDVLASARWQEYDAATNYLIVALRFVKDNPDATRREVKDHLHEWAFG